MAKKKNESSTVTRIKANDSPTQKKKVEAKTAVKPTAKAPKKDKKVKGVLKPFSLLIGYFKGAWYELKQVHWPNRKQTWGMTLAVILFTIFFVAMIVILDAIFKYVFEIILG